MLTSQQEEWIAHISTEKRVKIVPFDPTAEEKFQKLKVYIQESLGSHIPVMHRGSSSLGIGGQDEIDVYIPTKKEGFEMLQRALELLFGEPRSIYPFRRVRFTTKIDSKKIDLFLINEKHEDWLRGVAFEEECQNNSEILNRYRKLKENLNGATMQEFYRQKTEFINEVLAGAKK